MTQISRFYDLSVLLIFLNCESTCDLLDVPASVYDRKMDARPFDTIHGILRCLSLGNRFSKGEMRQFGASGTDGLNMIKMYNNWDTDLSKK